MTFCLLRTFRNPRAALLAIATSLLTITTASAACKVAATTLPVTMLGMRPLLPAQVNGQEALFILDSGAFFSAITPASASKYRLPRGPLPTGLSVTGATGGADADVGTVNAFTLAGYPLGRLQFVVSGGEFGEGAAGLLGQNVLGGFDVDYDLAHGAVRLLHVTGCDGKNLAYWAGDKPVSVMPMVEVEPNDKSHHAYAVIYVNGVRMIAMFDTGAAVSTISESAARRTGVKSQDSGVVPAGRFSGLGRKTLPAWLGTFKSIKIGGAELKNMKMMFGGIQMDNTDVLLGADFFLSHHVLVSNSQRQIYYTYNGGPVFALDEKPREIWNTLPGRLVKETVEDPKDAPGLARRGAASASRHDYDGAVVDLTHALEISPNDPDYLYERGRAYVGAGKASLAMADFDQALRLKPDDVPVLMARASLKLSRRDRDGARTDLNAADQAAAKQDDVRLALAQLYVSTDDLQDVIRQDDLWLKYHPEAAGMPVALNSRCWARALLGQELDKALADCNQGLRLAPRTASLFDSRGLVRLRQGDIEAAQSDYNNALALNPNLAWSLYGRGVIKARLGDSAGAAADISAAVAINPKLPDEGKRRGIDSGGAQKASSPEPDHAG